MQYRTVPPPSRSNGAASDLTLANGLLYGVAQYGGHAGGGSIVVIDPQTGKATVLYSFPRHNYFDTRAPCAGCAAPTAWRLYKLKR